MIYNSSRREVRVTDKATGISATCGQTLWNTSKQNKELAMRLLRAKLHALDEIIEKDCIVEYYDGDE